MNCKICKNRTNEIINFGRQPLANSFLKKKDFYKEFFYEMKIAYCKLCHTVQLSSIPNKKKFFNKDYAFVSQTSSAMTRHFKDFSEIIKKKLKRNKKNFILEIGSNDGIFLQNFSKVKNYTILGVEPATKISVTAKKNGINTLNDFFSYKLSKNIKKKYGEADIVYAANVFSHVSNIKNIVKGIKNLLEKKGQFIFEVPYLLDIIKKKSFDQIYNEHVYFFSIISLMNLFKNFKLYVTRADRINVHGGSIRVWIKKIPPNFLEKRKINNLIKLEKKNKLNSYATYKNFKLEILDIKNKLIKKIKLFRKKNYSVCGYGATAKSSTILNFCNFDSRDINYITDNTPGKISKYTPGSHIQVKSNNFFKKNLPDIVVLFAWNHKNEILKKEGKLKNIRWLTYNKTVKIFNTKIVNNFSKTRMPQNNV